MKKEGELKVEWAVFNDGEFVDSGHSVRFTFAPILTSTLPKVALMPHDATKLT